MRSLSILSAVALLTVASVADAHPKLLGANLLKPARIELHFSEKLMPQFTHADLLAGSTKLASATTVAPDGRTLVVTAKAPLRAGRYAVAWQAVSIDTHRVSGNYAFAVK